MRGTRRWLFVMLGLAALAGGVVAFYYAFVDTAYSCAEYYADTGLGIGVRSSRFRRSVLLRE